jgi:hypothetical protein
VILYHYASTEPVKDLQQIRELQPVFVGCKRCGTCGGRGTIKAESVETTAGFRAKGGGIVVCPDCRGAGSVL